MEQEITPSLWVSHKPEHVETRLCRLTVLAPIYIQTPPTHSVIQSQAQSVNNRVTSPAAHHLPPSKNAARVREPEPAASLQRKSCVVLRAVSFFFFLMCHGCFPVSILAQVFSIAGSIPPIVARTMSSSTDLWSVVLDGVQGAG